MHFNSNISLFLFADPFSGIVPESLCQLDHNSNTYLPKERRLDTFLSLDLKPGSFSGPCKQLFEAPAAHGLYVRVHSIGPVDKSKHENSISGGSHKNMNVDGQRLRNSTSIGSCPLNIVSHIHLNAESTINGKILVISELEWRCLLSSKMGYQSVIQITLHFNLI